jgi:hypothetical protein
VDRPEQLLAHAMRNEPQMSDPVVSRGEYDRRIGRILEGAYRYLRRMEHLHVELDRFPDVV